jgi:DNA polymerase III delta prime subunit
MHPLIHRILSSDAPTIPIIIDETGALEVIRAFSNISVSALEDCITGSIHWVSLYEKDITEDKKHLSVKDIRRWISDIAEIPYEKKHLYLIRDFDDATHEAMNATLKVLEEPPVYALILLIVKNPESLLETIISRSLNLYKSEIRENIPEELSTYVREYLFGRSIRLLEYLYINKIDRDIALGILLEASRGCESAMMPHIEEGISNLYNINETPRSILDRVFLRPRIG